MHKRWEFKKVVWCPEGKWEALCQQTLAGILKGRERVNLQESRDHYANSNCNYVTCSYMCVDEVTFSLVMYRHYSDPQFVC